MSDTLGATDVEGCAIAWHLTGTGAPLVLLNGYAATKDDWDPTFLAALAADRQLLCIDHRGLGGSQFGDVDVSIERMAHDVLAVMAALEIKGAPLLGWSMGGFIAQQAAALEPDRVEALALLSTDMGGPETVTCSPKTSAELTDHSGTPREQATRLIDLLYPAPLAAKIDAMFGEIVAAARAGLSAETLFAQEAALEHWHSDDAHERIAALRMPVLAAAGSQDAVIPSENSALLADALPQAWLARFARGGHGFITQQPTRLAALIHAFLSPA